MRLPNTAHTDRPWRIHELAGDFRIEDVWALPTPGGPDDFPELVALIASFDPTRGSSRTASALFAIREKAGQLLGLGDPTPGDEPGGGSATPTLLDRMPTDLRKAPAGPRSDTLPYTPLYLLDDEWAIEIANNTVHGVLHAGWVPDDDAPGGHRGQMAVLVKPNGVLGNAYMLAIKPFRHLLVYPALMRDIERKWARSRRRAPAAA